MTLLRTAWVLLVALTLLVILGLDILIHRWLDTRWVEDRCRRRPRQWCSAILWAAGVRVRMDGMEALHRHGGGQILVANHTSWFDVFALSARLPVEYRFVAKKELARIPIFGPAWVACRHIAIDRGDREAAIRSMEEAGRQIRQERPTIVVFPEGTRSPDGDLLPFKKGAFVLAIEAGVPVVPCGIAGSRGIMAKGSALIRSGTMGIRFGEPLEVGGLGHDDRDRLTERARAAVARLRSEAESTRLEGA